MNRKRNYKKYPIDRPIKSKSVYDNVHLVKRYGKIKYGYPGSLVMDYINNPADDQTHVFHFTLNAVAGYQDFTKLYDQYKIRAVSVSFIPMVNITSATLSGYASLIYSTYDFNGETGSPPPTKDEIREYQYCKWSPYGEIHTRYFYPRMTDTGIKPGPQNWISTVADQIRYNGLIVNVSNVPSIDVGEPIYKIEVRYYLSFKNTK